MVNKSKITKSIRINPTINKMLDKYCNLEQTTQANYINKLLFNDLNNRTLSREIVPHHNIIITLPKGKENIKECLNLNIDLREYNKESNYKEIVSLNNYLDVWKSGTYQSPVNNSSNTILHNGLILTKKDNLNYFIFVEYTNTNKVININLIDEDKAIKLSKIAENPELTQKINQFIKNIDYIISMGNLDEIELTQKQSGIFTSTLAEKSKENKELKTENEKLKSLCSRYENEIESLKNKNKALKDDILKDIELNFNARIKELIKNNNEFPFDRFK